MYTTPRKVKQESRLRRSLSLTNASRLINGGGPHNNGGNPNNPSTTGNGEDYSSGEYHRHLHDIEESRDSNSYFQFNGELAAQQQQQQSQRTRYSYSTGETIPDLVDCSGQDNSIVVHSISDQNSNYQHLSGRNSSHKPPAYQGPPQGEVFFGHQSDTSLIVVTPTDPSNHQGTPLTPDSPISLDSLQIHSSKFPIVKEVVISQQDPSSGSISAQNQNGVHFQNYQNQNQQQSQHQQNSHYRTTVPLPVLSPEYIKKFQNKKLTKKKQIAWTDERKAFTLDSQTAKDIQQRLAACPITRANSADLGKAIQDFNDEQTFLMSSMQPTNNSHRHLNGGGVDNPALDLGGHSGSNGHIHNPSVTAPNNHSNSNGSSYGGKMSGGYNYSDSSTSQSLSLSSSNTDSLDTVIYKGPSQSTTSIRDWQRSMESNGNGDFGHSHRHEPTMGNSYHRDSSGMFDPRYQIQQPQQSYQQQQQQQQQMQFNGSGGGGSSGNINNNGSNYAIEYRHSQQQHQVQQNLSVHSIPSSSTGNNGGANNGGGFPATRSGNGTQLPTKSPMLNRKQFSTATGQLQTENQSGGNNSTRVTFNGVTTTTNPPSQSDQMLVDKSKDSKLFPTKTYNHIKDMISSRFGHGNAATNSSAGNNGKGLNNASVVSAPTNVSNINGGVVNGPVNCSNNPPQHQQQNSYIDLTMGVPSAYPNSHQHQHNAQYNMNAQNYNGASNPNNAMNRAPQGQMPNGHPQQQYYPQNGMVAPNGVVPNCYKSPNMNDRKNVNTSFRKAIQQSTLKSNLTEDSLQLRPIMETNVPQQYPNSPATNRGMQQFAGNPAKPPHHHQLVAQHQQHDQETGVQERAQRALDKLMEAGVPLGSSGHMINPNNPVHNRIQQFSPSGSNHYPPTNDQFAPSSSRQQPNQNYPPSHAKHQYPHAQDPSGLNPPPRPSYNSVKPGPGSSNSNSSSGLAVVESSLSSPGSYTGTRLVHSSGDEIHGQHQLLQQQPQIHSQWAHLHKQNATNHNHHDQPPPLPTSQKPDSPEGSINTIGLPLPSLSSSVEIRENGDGSSATMDGANTGNMLLENCSKVKSDQLKQITTDLQNIALSVAAEQHMHHNNHSSSSECEKGPQRVGSGQSHTTTDSGLGTVMLTKSPLTSNSDPGEHPGPMRHNADSLSSGECNESEWVDLVEPEIQQILEIERSSKSGKHSSRTPSGIATGPNTSTPAALKSFQQQSGNNNMQNPNGGHNGTNLQSGNNNSKAQGGIMADITASPILHAKASQSPHQSPKLPKKFDLNTYNKKGSRSQSQELLAIPSTSQAAMPSNSKANKSPRVPAKVVQRSNSGSGQRWPNRPQRLGEKNTKTGGSRSKDLNQLKGSKLTRNAMNKLGQILYSLQDETGDGGSTTGLDFESAFDGRTDATTDDDDLSTTIDTTDAHAIRRQLESLESMYTEVLKVLGEKKFSRNRYPPSTTELRNAKRRPYGSMSSLPSSVSSRPFRERSRKLDDKKKVKDLKSINRRFQRLESHVVTLARSVAHLSSEMRTQHLMVQEMESIRNELQTLRNQVVKNTMQNQTSSQNFNRAASGRHGANPCTNQTDWTSFRNALPSLTNPCRVRKLTKFFGDEPPLIRIFLKKLGYEKYAVAFEQERIGIMELPYLTEERLNKMGIPMGPRLRILQEAQMCLKPGYQGQHDGHHSHHPNNHNTGNLSVYVV